MPSTKKTSLVPVSKRLPAVRKDGAVTSAFSLYEGERHFTDREDVRQHLPDILARLWRALGLTTNFTKPLIATQLAPSNPTVYLFQAPCRLNSNAKHLTGRALLSMSKTQIQNLKPGCCIFNL